MEPELAIFCNQTRPSVLEKDCTGSGFCLGESHIDPHTTNVNARVVTLSTLRWGSVAKESNQFFVHREIELVPVVSLHLHVVSLVSEGTL